MSNESRHQLHFPQKIKEEKEIVRGLDTKHFIYYIVSVIAIGIPILLFYLYTKTAMTSFLIFLISATGIYALWARLEESRVAAIDVIKYMIEYLKSPKQYSYSYYHELEIKESDEDDESKKENRKKKKQSD